MGISKRTVEELIEKNNAAIAKAKADIARLEGELSAFQKILAADAPPSPKQPRKPPGETIQRSIAAIQSAARPMTITELLTAIGEPDNHARRSNLIAAIHKKSGEDGVFIRTGKGEYGLRTLGHVAGEARKVTLMPD